MPPHAKHLSQISWHGTRESIEMLEMITINDVGLDYDYLGLPIFDKHPFRLR